MSNFDLSLTGAQINAALNKVHNPDSTPTNGSANVVTSDGVFDAVNDIQFANLNSSLVKTDISSGTNNTTLASSGAIKSYVDTQVAGSGTSVTTLERASEYSVTTESSTNNLPGVTITGSNVSVNNNVYTIQAGCYLIYVQAELRGYDGGGLSTSPAVLEITGAGDTTDSYGNSGDEWSLESHYGFKFTLSQTAGYRRRNDYQSCFLINSSTFNIYFYDSAGGSTQNAKIRNFRMDFVKLA